MICDVTAGAWGKKFCDVTDHLEVAVERGSAVDCIMEHQLQERFGDFLGIFWGMALIFKKVAATTSRFNRSPSALPSVAVGNRNQFYCLIMVLNNNYSLLREERTPDRRLPLSLSVPLLSFSDSSALQLFWWINLDF